MDRLGLCGSVWPDHPIGGIIDHWLDFKSTCLILAQSGISVLNPGWGHRGWPGPIETRVSS